MNLVACQLSLQRVQDALLLTTSMAILTMAILTMAILTMAILTMAILTMAILTMAILTMQRIRDALLGIHDSMMETKAATSQF